MKHNTQESDIESCAIEAIHKDIVSKVSQDLPEINNLLSLASLFKMFGDGTRLSILWALSRSELCVCDICALLNLKQSAVSHQLNKLKMSKIVKNRREGKVVFYSLTDDHVREMLEMGMEHVIE
jgi:ArsR family transcriptional regulator